MTDPELRMTIRSTVFAHLSSFSTNGVNTLAEIDGSEVSQVVSEFNDPL